MKTIKQVLDEVINSYDAGYYLDPNLMNVDQALKEIKEILDGELIGQSDDILRREKFELTEYTHRDALRAEQRDKLNKVVGC